MGLNACSTGQLQALSPRRGEFNGGEQAVMHVQDQMSLAAAPT